MGAKDFESHATGKDAAEAFTNAREQAAWDYGHAGYTGTIAEKHDFKMFPMRDGETVAEAMNRAMDDENGPYYDKWGPAACIEVEPGNYVFFGSASS